jgi:hypothetical protein
MRREDCSDMLKRIPVLYHPQVNVVMRNQAVVAVDVIVREEPTYLVLKGREGGTTDEGRAFFIPYDEIAYLRLERTVKIRELKEMYGETGYIDEEDKLGQAAEAEAADKAAAEAPAQPDATPAPAAAAPMDPASIAKQNLLDRIRAARAGAASGKLTGGKK